MIQPLQRKHIEAVVAIHLSELHGFLTELGHDFLVTFYATTLRIPYIFTFVEIEKDTVSGFVTGTTITKNLYRNIIVKDLMGFISIFIGFAISHPQKTLKMVKTLAYPGFSNDNPELLTIAIDRKNQGKGYGKSLFNAVKSEFKKRECHSFRVSVYNSLPAVGFYKIMKCKLIRVFDFLGEKMSYFEYELSS